MESLLIALTESERHSGKRLRNGKYQYQGKVGVWRTAANGDKMFFPDDGSAPLAGKRTMDHSNQAGIPGTFREKKGVWKTAENGDHVFYPEDGSASTSVTPEEGTGFFASMKAAAHDLVKMAKGER